jgi:hypothetical protein
MWNAIGWIVCISIISGVSYLAWAKWLLVQPACTMAEFAKIVKQLNVLTEAMSEVKASADSVRSAVAMSRIGMK